MKAVVLACSLALAGCGHVLYTGDFSGEQDGWSLHVTELRDGPNTFKQNNVLYFPENGTKLLWAHVIVKNGAAIRRKFDFSSCFLDFGRYGVPATLAALSLVMNSYGNNMRAELDAGEETDRYVGFAYPVEYLPRVLACGPDVTRIVIKLPMGNSQ